MDDVLDALDHPIPFVFLMTIAVMCTAAIITWGAKAAGWNGLAALMQHP